jgi:hypothetical protein
MIQRLATSDIPGLTQYATPSPACATHLWVQQELNMALNSWYNCAGKRRERGHGSTDDRQEQQLRQQRDAEMKEELEVVERVGWAAALMVCGMGMMMSATFGVLFLPFVAITDAMAMAAASQAGQGEQRVTSDKGDQLRESK